MGKHIFCEKPLTHTVYEARYIRELAKKYKVQTQMGNQGHSSDEIRSLKEWIDSGAIGKVREVFAWTDRPVGGKPWSTFAVKETMNEQKYPEPDEGDAPSCAQCRREPSAATGSSAGRPHLIMVSRRVQIIVFTTFLSRSWSGFSIARIFLASTLPEKEGLESRSDL